MASTKAPEILAYKAAAALTKGHAVKKGADDEHVQVCSAGSDKGIGIIQNDVTTADDVCEVAVMGGAKGLAGGAIVQGDLLAADSNGALVATTTANDRVLGVAEEDAASGDLFSVLVGLSNV